MYTQWKPALKGGLAKRAHAIALDVAQRCRSQANIDQAIVQEQKRDSATSLRWRPSSVAGGNAGIALMAAYVHACVPDQGWDAVTHEYLARAVASYNAAHPDLSLFSGGTGLALTATIASQNGKHYAGLRQGLNAYLDACIPPFVNRVNKQAELHVPDFDLISGAAGLMAYGMLREKNEPSDGAAYQAVLRYLVALAVPDRRSGLYCFIPPKNIGLQERRDQYPHGYADTGLAHGVSGVIGTLALAISSGWPVPCITEALTTLTRWLLDQQRRDQYGINWPTFIESEHDGRHDASKQGSRAAWCYGIPGIARALYMAGEALDDAGLKQAALSAFDSFIVRPRERWGISSPNFCHGLSGILQASLRMYHDTGAKHLQMFSERITQELLSLYDPDTLFGFQDRNAQGMWYDNPRMLEGAPGVVLALLAATEPVTPEWDRLFLLS